MVIVSKLQHVVITQRSTTLHTKLD